MSTSTFSGCHDFDPSCVQLQTELDWIGVIEGDLGPLGAKISETVRIAVEAGTCPRCEDPLPAPPEAPAGSRTTPCRCVPICAACGSDETYQGLQGTGMSQLDQWPVGKSARTRRRNKFQKNAVVVETILTEDKLITEVGVSELKFRDNPGGWLEFGREA